MNVNDMFLNELFKKGVYIMLNNLHRTLLEMLERIVKIYKFTGTKRTSMFYAAL